MSSIVNTLLDGLRLKSKKECVVLSKLFGFFRDHKFLLFFLTAIFFVMLIYKQAFYVGFAYVDDEWMLLDEELVRRNQFDLNYIKDVFLRVNSLQYSPLNTLYYSALHKINGYDPFWYHLGSIILHIFNVFLIYVLCLKLSNSFRINNQSRVAGFTTLLWAILPFNVEAVVWISASKIPLSSFWILLSTIFFIQGYEKKVKQYFFLSLGCYILAFLSKEQAIVNVFVLLAYIICKNKKDKISTSWNDILRYIYPFLVLAFLFALITLYSVIYADGEHNVDRYPFHQRLILSFYCLCFYIFNLFIPVNLHYHYPFPMKIGAAVPLHYFGYVIIVFLLCVQLVKLVKGIQSKYLFIFCLSTFLINIFLVIQIIPIARAAMLADRYMYLASFGLIMTFIVACENFLGVDKKTKIKTYAYYIFFFIYLTLLALYSTELVGKWANMRLSFLTNFN